MPRLHIEFSEARLAIAISLLALLATLWQAIEANRANAANEERLTVEVRSSVYDAVACDIANLQVRYSLILVNNSAQPALVTNIKWVQRLSSRVLPHTTAPMRYDGNVLEAPVSIPAKGFHPVEVVAWTPVSDAGYRQLVEAGLCRYEDVNSMEARLNVASKFVERPALQSLRDSIECLNSGWPENFLPERDTAFKLSVSTATTSNMVTLLKLPTEIACLFRRDADRLRKTLPQVGGSFG